MVKEKIKTKIQSHAQIVKHFIPKSIELVE